MKLGPLLGVCLQRAPLASAFLKGPDRPELGVVAAVLFFVGPPPDTRRSRGEERAAGMRQARHGVDRALLPVFARIIECYCPYVLVRCCRYTNGRRQAQQIGVYTLVSACLVAREASYVLPVGRIVETMLRVIGPDVLAGARGEDWRAGPDEPLLADPWMRHMATALNAQKRRGREVLVLHHVAGLTTPDLARLVEQPRDKVRARIGRAERRLARWLGVRDVRPLLARFAAGLDAAWIREVAGGARDYLAQRAPESSRVLPN
jgi:DNA-directed RNA polymerase specialized sigma24 family protein